MKIALTLVFIFVINGLFAQIIIEESNYQDRPHYKISTPSAIYIYDRAGGGFSSIIDKDGLDWISYKKDSSVATYPKSGGGQYRGLPNAVFGNEDGGCGHPGFDKAISEKSASNVITTKSKSGLWEWSWTFYNDYAVWSVTKTDPDYFYWLLYEGTVGGKWNNLTDKYWGSSNTMSGKITDFYKNQAIFEPSKFQYFGDKTVNRIFYIVQKDLDELDDLVGWLGNKPEGMELSPDGMVVAGLGRNKKGKPSMTKPNTFRIGFFEKQIITQKEYDKLKKRLDAVKY